MKEHRFAFFRQSGWMLVATIGGGVFMTLVQSAAQRMPVNPRTGDTEYGLFASLMGAMAQLGIPALGLQTVFAQQAVGTSDEERRAAVAGTVRGIVKLLLFFWLIFFGLALCFQSRLAATYKIENLAALWLTLAVAFVSLLNPLFAGLLQGRQDFLWFGWGTILNGVGRFIAVLVLVIWLHMQAAGAMAGVLVGSLAALTIFVWRTRELWRGPVNEFDWRNWLRRVVPLTVGLGAFTYMFTQDMLTVQRVFAKDTDQYGAARIIGTALVFLTAPLAQVLFPKVARSAALSETTNVLAQALGMAAIVGALAALGCTLLPKLPLKILQSPFVESSGSLVPWFAWCMLPLTIANVLINNLLARERFAAVPWIATVAAGYGITLHYFHPSFVRVIQTLGAFGVLLVAVCVVFTIRQPRAAT